MQPKQLERLDKEWMKAARELRLLDDKHFVQALNEYNKHCFILDKMNETIREKGVTIVVPVGKDGEKTITNPVVNDLLRVEKSAQSLRKELDEKMEKAIIIHKKEQEDDIRL